MNIFVFWFKCHRSLFLLTIYQHWLSDYGLAPSKHQVIIWTTDSIVYWRICASLSLNQLTKPTIFNMLVFIGHWLRWPNRFRGRKVFRNRGIQLKCLRPAKYFFVYCWLSQVKIWKMDGNICFHCLPPDLLVLLAEPIRCSRVMMAIYWTATGTNRFPQLT